MTRWNRPSFVPGAAIVLSLLGSFTGCGWLDEAEDATTLRFPIEFDIPTAVTIPYPSSAEISALPVVSGAERRVLLPAIYPIPVDIEALDPTGKVAEYRDRIKGIEISAITANVTSNTFPVAVQPIEIRVGEPSDSFENATIAATLPEVAAGATPSAQNAVIDASKRESVGNVLQSLTFRMGARTSILVPEGSPPEGGSVSMKLRVKLDIVASLSSLAGL
jgi:hypothetical protein